MSNIVEFVLGRAIWVSLPISLVIVAALGVFKPKRIIGPDRLAPGESPRVLTIAIASALAAWCFCPIIFALAHEAIARHKHVVPTTQFSEPETVVYSALMEIIVFIGMITATVLTRVDGLRRIGFAPTKIPAGIPAGVLGIVLVLPFVAVVNQYTELALDHMGWSHPIHRLLEVLKENPPPWLRITDIIAAGLIAPVAEEMFFRGILQTTFRYLFNRSWPAIVVAALFFAMLHQWYTWPPIFVLGIGLGYVYERTGNLWASIAMHASFNLLTIFFFTHST
jgi:membrane protease YdiL (CAAX protease family)